MKNAPTIEIFIENFVVSGKHGVYPSERHLEQEFILDIKLQAAVEKATAEGRFEETVDYDWILNTATDIIKSEHEYLIERLAARIAQQLLENSKVREVAVTIRKPGVWPNGVPGVTVVRMRSK